MTTKAKHDIHGKPYNRTAMITLLLIATFAGVLNQTSLGTAIPTLMNSFNICCQRLNKQQHGFY